MINLWFLFIALEVARNYYMIEKQKTVPNYLQSFILRGIASILHGIAVGVVNTKEYAILVIFQCCAFWILFDLALNLFRGKSPIHKGKNNLIDRFADDIYWIFKCLAALAGFICYMLIIGL